MSGATVTFLIQLPLSDRDRRRYCIDALLHAGFAVHVVDFGPYLLPALPAERPDYPAITDISLTVVADESEMKRAMAAINRRGGVVVCLIAGRTFTPAAARILRRLRRVPYVQFLNGAIPGDAEPVVAAGFARRLIRLLRNGGLWTSILGRVPPAWQGIPAAAAAIYGGHRSHGGGRLVGPTTRPILAHAEDWEHVREMAAQPVAALPMAVFLDQFLPFHPDFIELGARGLAPGPYFTALRRLFDRIESELGLDVVIAAHPRSDYHTRGGALFGQRRLVKGDSATLIRDSRLVIGHYSTALGLAAALGKPVLLVGSRDISAMAPAVERMACAVAAALNCPRHSLDAIESIDLSAALTVDGEAYRRFVDDYLKSPNSPDLPMATIVIEALARLFPHLLLPSDSKTTPRTFSREWTNK